MICDMFSYDEYAIAEHDDNWLVLSRHERCYDERS